MGNAILQLFGMVFAISAFIVVNFLVALYISVKRLGGTIENKDLFLILAVALVLFLLGVGLTLL